MTQSVSFNKEEVYSLPEKIEADLSELRNIDKVPFDKLYPTVKRIADTLPKSVHTEIEKFSSITEETVYPATLLVFFL